MENIPKQETPVPEKLHFAKPQVTDWILIVAAAGLLLTGKSILLPIAVAIKVPAWMLSRGAGAIEDETKRRKQRRFANRVGIVGSVFLLVSIILLLLESHIIQLM
ncbi:MAG TPA: hypothetical protein VFK12_01760 [Gammaproteobacteria bacterium]|nr:hypothetical protein [Gammaproteobacteria bacterium]